MLRLWGGRLARKIQEDDVRLGSSGGRLVVGATKNAGGLRLAAGLVGLVLSAIACGDGAVDAGGEAADPNGGASGASGGGPSGGGPSGANVPAPSTGEGGTDPGSGHEPCSGAVSECTQPPAASCANATRS